jgi:hypothetical protein
MSTTSTPTWLPTAAVVGLITVLLYWIWIRPILPNIQNNGNRQQPAATTTTHRASRQQQQQQQLRDKSTGHAKRCSHTPPHLNEMAKSIASSHGSNILTDGLVAFKYTKAGATTTTTMDEDCTDLKLRARVLSNLLKQSNTTTAAATTADTNHPHPKNSNHPNHPIPPPPAKGSLIVLAIRLEACPDVSTQRVIRVLASYYNLFLILAVPEEIEENRQPLYKEEEELERIRNQWHVHVPMLPLHRILLSRSLTGRVAVARQLERVDLVVDFDRAMIHQLARFGHRVIVMEDNADPQQQPPQSLGTILLATNTSSSNSNNNNNNNKV